MNPALEGRTPVAARSRLDRWLCAVPWALILVYKKLVSPLLGSHCRFYPSCSVYARQAFEQKKFLTACRLTLFRLAKCHPFHPGGYDPLDPDPEERPQSNPITEKRQPHG
jgi:putative membrane protein insertion efficiency factor